VNKNFNRTFSSIISLKLGADCVAFGLAGSIKFNREIKNGSSDCPFYKTKR